MGALKLSKEETVMKNKMVLDFIDENFYKKFYSAVHPQYKKLVIDFDLDKYFVQQERYEKKADGLSVKITMNEYSDHEINCKTEKQTVEITLSVYYEKVSLVQIFRGDIEVMYSSLPKTAREKWLDKGAYEPVWQDTLRIFVLPVIGGDLLSIAETAKKLKANCIYYQEYKMDGINLGKIKEFFKAQGIELISTDDIKDFHNPK